MIPQTKERFFKLAEPSYLDLGKKELSDWIKANIKYYTDELHKLGHTASSDACLNELIPKYENKIREFRALKNLLIKLGVI